MFRDPRVPNVRLGGLGIFSIGVIAFALATLQGCAPATVGSSTAHGARDTGSPVIGLGPLGVDPPALVAAREPRERVVPARAESHAREPRSVNLDRCTRCR